MWLIDRRYVDSQTWIIRSSMCVSAWSFEVGQEGSVNLTRIKESEKPAGRFCFREIWLESLDSLARA